MSGAIGNTIVVTALADFPPPSADVITLADNTNYLIVGEVDLGANRIVCGTRCGISGTNRVNDRLITSHVGAMFTASSNVSVVFNEIGLRCASGTLLDVTSTGIAFLNCSVGPCANGGNIALSGAFGFTYRTTNTASAFTVGGFTFTGSTTGNCRIFDSTASGNVGTLFDLGTAVFAVIDIGRNIVSTDVGNTFLDGTTGSANVTEYGSLSNNTFFGAGTVVATIVETDTDWRFTNNAGVTNTPVSASATWGAIVGTVTDQTDLALDTINPPTASVSFADQQATSFRIENRTSDPGSPTEGQLWLRTDL